MRKIAVGLMILLLGCASVEPGTLTQTMRENDDQRAYYVCMQQGSLFKVQLRAHCLRQSRYRWVMWAWEDCSNEGKYDCGLRPRWEDVP